MWTGKSGQFNSKIKKVTKVYTFLMLSFLPDFYKKVTLPLLFSHSKSANIFSLLPLLFSLAPVARWIIYFDLLTIAYKLDVYESNFLTRGWSLLFVSQTSQHSEILYFYLKAQQWHLDDSEPKNTSPSVQ